MPPALLEKLHQYIGQEEVQLVNQEEELTAELQQICEVYDNLFQSMHNVYEAINHSRPMAEHEITEAG